MGVWQGYYQTHQLAEYSSSTVSWITSVGNFMTFFLIPFVGALQDRFGPKPLVLGGTILHVLGLMMTSLATKYYHFLLAQGICSPIGISMLFYPGTSSIVTWFSKKRGLALGTRLPNK